MRYWMSIMKTITEEKAMRMLNPVHPGRFLRTGIIDAHDLAVAGASLDSAWFESLNFQP